MLWYGKENKQMSDVIRIKKKDVKKILKLYTIEGLTQKETARIVLGERDIKGVSTYTVVQRVLHYFGLNMEYRRDYRQEGLTEEIVDLILANRTLAFPLAVPVNEKMNPAVSFDLEVNRYLGNNGKKWERSAKIKNGFVICILMFLTYFEIINPIYDSTALKLTLSILYFYGIIFGGSLLEGGIEGKGIENINIKEWIKEYWLLILLFVLPILVAFFKVAKG